LIIVGIKSLLFFPPSFFLQGHSDIEKEEETRFKVESLPFSALAVDEVERNYDKPEVDALFG